MFIRIDHADMEFAAVFRQAFEELHVRLDPAKTCDGVACNAPGAPHDPAYLHWHLVFRAPDLDREVAVYMDWWPM